MGRAIVREPAAFLMDEPLSNLDAKLSVQTSAEIAKLQSDLGVTTLYVTHDQVEALTMGDRVAVMRKGELQQVDDPQTLYDRPVNIFVGGFIGSPAMNMLDAQIEQSNGGLSAKIGEQTISLGAETISQRPSLKAYAGKQVIIGIRPEDLEDAAIETGRAGRPHAPRPTGTARGARQRDHGPLRDRSRARRDGRDARDRRRRRRERPKALRSAPTRTRRSSSARFSPRSRVTPGDEMTAVVDTRALHFFDPATGAGIYDEMPSNERRQPMRKRWPIVAAVVAVGALAALAGTQLASASKSSQTNQAAVSGSMTFDGIWTGAEAASFGKVIKAFNKVYPNVKVKYKPVGNNVSTVLATAIAGGHPPDMADIAQPGLVKQLAQQGHLKPIGYAKSVIAANFAPAWQQLGSVNGKQYALVFKAANKSLLWYNVPAFKAAGVTAPKTWAQLTSAGKTLQASGTPAFSIGGADGWTLTDLFENIYLRTYGAAKYESLSAHKIKWTDASVTKALKTMGQILGKSSNLAGGTSGALTYGFNDSVTNAFASPPKAAIVFEGDFVAGVITSSTKAKPKTGFNATPFPAITPGANAERGRDRRRSVRHLPRHARDRGVREVPGDRPGGQRLGADRRLRHRQQERAGEHLSGCDHARHRSSDRSWPSQSCSTCRTSSPPPSAPPRARASGASSSSS